MKVILLKTIDKLGLKNEVLNVKDGYASNYLLPCKLAIVASPSNLKKHQQQIKLAEEKKEKNKKLASSTAKKVENIMISIMAKAEDNGKLYGSIGAKAIAKKLREEGYKVDSKNIDIKKPIKILGEHQVELSLNDKKVMITVNVKKQKEQ